MSSDTPLSVVIAGGGFCGTMTLVHLLRKTQGPAKITLINKSYPIGRGIAYKTYSDKHLLNVEARNMSAFPDVPDHFAKWASRQEDTGIPVDEIPTSYLPRNLYGRYLDEIYSDALRNKPGYIEIDIVDDILSDAEIKSGRYHFTTAKGKKIDGDCLILATGNSEPGLPYLTNTDFQKGNRYFNNPWSEQSVTGAADELPVVIVGNGLTMVDVVIGLREKNFSGKLISISPRGFDILPHRKAPAQKYILEELAPPYSVDGLFRLFYKHIRTAKKNGFSGETVVDAMRGHTQEIWQQLSLHDRKKFMAHLRHLWGVARHRLPAHVHGQMQQLIAEKKLEVIAGRIRSIEDKKDSIAISFTRRRDQANETIQAGRIINCTGPQPDIRRQNNPLLHSLMSKGMICSDDMNLGIDATTEGRVIDAEGKVSDSLFAMGSLLKGKLWESTAVPELRGQAARIADLILHREKIGINT